MKKILQRMFFAGAVMMLAACGSSSSTSTSGTISGKVVNNNDGAAVASATVTVGTASATTAADGTYSITGITAGSGKVITVAKSGFVFGSKIATVSAGVTTTADIALLPVANTSTFDPTAAKTITATGSAAQVVLPANSLRTASGGSPSGNVTGNLTPIDPSSNPQLMPGNYTTSAGGMMESFGAIEVSFTDSTGAALNLASGQSATIRIPVAAGATSPPSTMPAFYYNATTGLWVQEGTLTLAGTAPNQYYTGTVTHFSYWNADQVYNTTCITGKVVDSAGVAVAGARVEAQGRDYIGTSETYSAADGTFSVLAKANSTVIVIAVTSNALSQSEVVTTGSAGTSCTSLSTDLKLGAIIGSSGSGSARIKLTWGLNPTDLDSHLTGPDPTSTSRFHVYYSSRGSMVAAPYAELDVDDTSSFGPEVITISRLFTGTYRYSVHHYSGTGTIYTSPARVELTLNGSTTVYTPPNPGSTVLGGNSVWQVFEITVSSSGTATVTPLNTYTTASASAVTKPLAASLEEHIIFSNLPKK